jgi:predicted  nucleic acid-binding Zn-ribbon protein
MHPAIPRLIEVQRVDLRIAALRADLDAFPKRIREADARLAGAKKEVAAAKEALAASLRERKKFELDVEQWKERARKYRDQSGAVKTNEAYKALLHEIANAEAEVAKAEDRLLEQLMAAEEFDRRLKAAEAASKDAEKVVQAERKQIDAERAALKKELEAALAEREVALSPVPEDLRDHYLRIAKRHHGVALAEARNEQCLGCGMRVLPHVNQELRRVGDETIFHCETCGRILYFTEPAPASAASGIAAAAAAADPVS